MNSSSLKASTKRKKDSEGYGGDGSDAVAAVIACASLSEFPKQNNKVSMASSLINQYESRNLNGNPSGNKMISEAICGSIEQPESMSLKKCVINSKESKDSAYKNLF